MLKRMMIGLLSMLIGATALTGCKMFGDGIPPEQLGNYGIVVSRISEGGRNMDTLPSSLEGRDTTAYVSWINGKRAMPARASINMLPGEYEFQVGLGCSNSASIAHLSADATDNTQQGAGSSAPPTAKSPNGQPYSYRALVDLKAQELIVDGIKHTLSPGMQVTAEIHLGTRTIFEYLLSPVMKAFQEAGRER